MIISFGSLSFLSITIFTVLGTGCLYVFMSWILYKALDDRQQVLLLLPLLFSFIIIINYSYIHQVLDFLVYYFVMQQLNVSISIFIHSFYVTLLLLLLL